MPTLFEFKQRGIKMKKAILSIMLFLGFYTHSVFAAENAIVKSQGDDKKMTYQAFENGKLSSTLVLEKIDDKNTRVTVSYNNIKAKASSVKLLQKDGKTGETFPMKLIRDDKNPQGFWQVILFFCLHGSVSYNQNSGWAGTFEYDCSKFVAYNISFIN